MSIEPNLSKGSYKAKMHEDIQRERNCMDANGLHKNQFVA